jgi:hypothetical protein
MEWRERFQGLVPDLIRICAQTNDDAVPLTIDSNLSNSQGASKMAIFTVMMVHPDVKGGTRI